MAPSSSSFRSTTKREALRLANDTPYGLAGAVWTRDVFRGMRVLKQIRAGILWLNTYHPTYNEAPWGGYKQSGFGRELGSYGLEQYLETKQINLNLSEAPIAWYLTQTAPVRLASATQAGDGQPQQANRQQVREAEDSVRLQDAVPDFRRPAGHLRRHDLHAPPRSGPTGQLQTELTFFLWTCLLLGGMATVLGPVVGAMIFWVVLSLTQGILYGA